MLKQVKALEAKLKHQSLHEFSREVTELAFERFSHFMQGISTYYQSEHPMTEHATPYETVWQEGSGRLLYYPSTHKGNPVLIVPSLINRSYILDLAPGHSLVEYLQEQGREVYLLDWGSPTEDEWGFTCTDYITKRIEPAFNAIKANNPDLPISIIGYCMGGVLAFATAYRQMDAISGLALLASPWDFSIKQQFHIELEEQTAEEFEALLTANPTVSKDFIQSIFYLAKPYDVQKKYEELLKKDSHSPALQQFMVIEHWVNDGIDMTVPVAKECLLSWGHYNKLMTEGLTIEGNAIDPVQFNKPAFIAIPQNDRIVAAESSEALVKLLPKKTTTVIRPNAGHVSMMIGSHAKADLWDPLNAWLEEIS